jgi:hypothetical protein
MLDVILGEVLDDPFNFKKTRLTRVCLPAACLPPACR